MVGNYSAASARLLLHFKIVTECPAARNQAAESRGTRADHGDFIPCVRQADRRVGLHLQRVPVGDEPFDAVDVDRAVNRVAAAVRLARMRADPPADGGQRVGVLDDGQRLREVSTGDMVDVLLNVDVGRTAKHAGRHAAPVVAQKRLE